MGAYDVGDEPDPRYTLANERTFLAWVRTALAVIAGGVALHSLEVPEQTWLRQVLVVVLLLLGGGTTVLAYRRWMLVERAMRTGRPLPRFGLGVVITGAMLVAAVLLAVTLSIG
jgi:putative membrane protein